MTARVLVVDDDAAMRRSLSLLLRALGHEATITASGEAALAAMQWQTFDVLLLDLRMPGLSGAETWTRMRALGAPLPVAVLMTAAAEGPHLAAEHSMLLLSKPFGLATLVAVVNEALARRTPR